MNHRCLGPLLAALSLLAWAATGSAQDAETSRLASQVCASCHGPHGDSISSAFPRLAGQNAAYIAAQLKSFKNQTRGDPYAQAYMWGMAAQLDDDVIGRLAAYYAAETPPAGKPGDPGRMAMGRRLFENGVPETGIPACAACHGDRAQGKEEIPRLAGQHPEYLVKQLAAFKSLQRGNAVIMHVVTDKMTLDQMRAVAEYASSM